MPSATTEARSLPLIAVVLIAFVLVINIRVIAGGKTWNDTVYHTEIAPARLAAGEAVRSASIPAWWDGTGFGVPLLGEPSHGALVPAVWLAASPRSLDWIQLLHLAWCALGVAVWARRRTPQPASDPSALVAGLLVATTGVLASAAVRGALPGLAHLPWIGACAAALATAGTRRERARLGAALGALVGLVALSGVFAALVHALVIAVALAGRRSSARWLVGALAGGLAIGCAQWLPALLHLPHAAGATVHGLPLARLLELIVPGAFGATDASHAIAALAGTHAWAPSVFVGAPLIAFAAVRTPPRRSLVIIALLVALALIAGRGGWPAWLGAPELHLGALAIVLGAHAGIGIDALLGGERRALRSLAAAVGLSAVALLALVALRSRQPESASAIDRALLDGGIGVVLVAGALALAWRASGRYVPLVLALLVLPAAGAQGSIAPLIERDVVTREPAFVAALAEAPRPLRVYRPVSLHEVDDLAALLATLTGSSSARWGITGARSESPARSAVHDRVWLAAAQEGGALLDRFGIGVAILPATLVDSPRSQFHELARRGEWALVSLPVTPIAAVVRSVLWQRDPDEALALMFPRGGGTNMMRGQIVLAGSGPVGQSPLTPSPCSIDHWRPGDIALRCTAEGYAVLTSGSAPGWTAEVNGVETAWYTADVLRRAVPVPAAASVTWSFRAPGFVLGVLLALLGVLGLAALLAVKSPPPDDVN